MVINAIWLFSVLTLKHRMDVRMESEIVL